MADFVRVDAWLDSDGSEYTSTTDYGTEIKTENDYFRMKIFDFEHFEYTFIISFWLKFFFISIISIEINVYSKAQNGIFPLSTSNWKKNLVLLSKFSKFEK